MNVKAIVSITFGLACALFVIVDIMISKGNALGRTYLYFAVAFFIVGVLNPQKSMYIIILVSAYLDHFKRLLVVYGRPSQVDVAYVQAIPILLLMGAFIGSFVGMFFGKYRSNKNIWFAFFASGFLAPVGVLPGLMGGGGGEGELRGIGGSINAGFYAVMIFLVPLHFSNAAALRKLINFSIITYIPVAIYLLKQAIFGLAEFEYNYLLTGLSLEARILWEQNALRGFSTMNGAGVVSVFMSLMAVAVLYPLRMADERKSQLNMFMRVLCSCFFIAAAWFTASRGGWFCGIAAAIGVLCYRKKLTTILLYSSATLGFAAVVVFSPYLHDQRILDDWQMTLDSAFKSDSGKTDDFLDRAIVLGTFNDRLLGWKNLTQRPDIWTPFGFSAAGKVVDWQKDMIGHDITIDLLLRFGYVPITLGIILAIYFAYYIHSFILNLPRDSLEKRISVITFSLMAGIFFGGFSNGAQLRVFPQNLFFYMFLGMILAIYFVGKKNSKVSNSIIESGSGGLYKDSL